MNIIIVGLGSAGKHYLKLLKNYKATIFVLDKKRLSKSKLYKLITLEKIIKENIKFEYAIVASPSGLHLSMHHFFLKRIKCSY